MDEHVLDRLIREAEEDTHPSSSSSEESKPMSPADAPVGGGLGNLLSEPAVWSLLPALLGRREGGGKAPSEGEATPTAKHTNRHTALLRAIKPYLGKERQQTAEQLIGMCRLWDTLQTSGLLHLLPNLMGDGATSAEPNSSADESKEV